MATVKLSRRQNAWSDYEDKLLHRVYRYLWSTKDLGLWLVIHPDDIHEVKQFLLVDSAYADDKCSEYCTIIGAAR